ncbi:hypothetical protein ACFL1B_06030 [Nanoarchaeota archaeon]
MKGQIQTGELIMVIMIVMVLIIMGLVGYASFRKSGAEETQMDFAELRTVDVAQEIIGMEELKCSQSRESSSQCVDVLRIESFVGMMEGLPATSPVSNFYSNKFGPVKIEITQVYPAPVFPQPAYWLLYDGTPIEFTSATPLQLPVYLYDPVEQHNAFGYVTLVRYS